jgi:8-oxo-dGTP pyrophosphatase MutT (NUDIX family)
MQKHFLNTETFQDSKIAQICNQAHDPKKIACSLAIVFPENNQLKTLLIKRSKFVPSPSKIEFPGGTRDNNDDYYQTALREVNEEIGIEQSNVEFLAQLSSIHNAEVNFWIANYLVWLDQKPKIQIDPHEIEKCETIEINSITKSFCHSLIFNEEEKVKQIVPGFNINDNFCYGSTAITLIEVCKMSALLKLENRLKVAA